MSRSVVAFPLLVLMLAACAQQPVYTGPKPAPAHNGTPVAASFGKTWDAVIDIFASKNISIKTVDRSSGLIVAEPQTISNTDPTYGLSIADCGDLSGGTMAYESLNGPILPTSAFWNVLVRGDSSTSTVRATVRFVGLLHIRRNPSFGEVMQGGAAAQVHESSETKECESKGKWEPDLEKSVKAAAEAKK